MSNVIKFQAPFERLKLYNDSPYVSLFKAIITQAIIDATNVCDIKEAKRLEIDAKKWIFSNNEYFQQICLGAEIEPSFVVKITTQLIKLHKTQTSFRNKFIKKKKMMMKKKKNRSCTQDYSKEYAIEF